MLFDRISHKSIEKSELQGRSSIQIPVTGTRHDSPRYKIVVTGEYTDNSFV